MTSILAAFIILVSVSITFSSVIDLRAEYKYVDDELKGIPDRSKQVETLKLKLVAERIRRKTDAREKEIVNLKLKAAEKTKRHFDNVIYCNIYREQTVRFEVVFSKPGFHESFPTFKDTFEQMVTIFNAERTKFRKKQILTDPQPNFSHLSRKEKWRVIQTWFFTETIVNSKIIAEPEITDDESLFLDAVRSDFKHLNDSVDFLDVAKLRNYWLKIFKIEPSFNIDQIERIIKNVSVGVHDGFQRCSTYLKRFQRMVISADQFPRIGFEILPKSGEEANDAVVRLCMDLIVNLGKQLASE